MQGFTTFHFYLVPILSIRKIIFRKKQNNTKNLMNEFYDM